MQEYRQNFRYDDHEIEFSGIKDEFKDNHNAVFVNYDFTCENTDVEALRQDIFFYLLNNKVPFEYDKDIPGIKSIILEDGLDMTFHEDEHVNSLCVSANKEDRKLEHNFYQCFFLLKELSGILEKHDLHDKKIDDFIDNFDYDVFTGKDTKTDPGYVFRQKRESTTRFFDGEDLCLDMYLEEEWTPTKDYDKNNESRVELELILKKENDYKLLAKTFNDYLSRLATDETEDFVKKKEESEDHIEYLILDSTFRIEKSYGQIKVNFAREDSTTLESSINNCFDSANIFGKFLQRIYRYDWQEIEELWELLGLEQFDFDHDWKKYSIQDLIGNSQDYIASSKTTELEDLLVDTISEFKNISSQKSLAPEKETEKNILKKRLMSISRELSRRGIKNNMKNIIEEKE